MGLLTPGLIHDAHSPDLALRLALTHRGQADFAEPALNATCRECVHWGEAGKRNRKGRWGWGVLEPQRCMKRSAGAPRVPHRQTACRKFTLNPDAPPEAGP